MAAPTITDSVIAMGTGAGPIVTGNLTIGSGEVLYVGVVLSDGSPGTVASVTSSGGGGALSSIADSGVVQSFLRLHVWRSTSPTSGTVTVSATPTASTSEIAVIAVSVAGVDSGTPNGAVVFSDGNGFVDAVSGTVSSGTDAIVLDFMGRFQVAAGTPGSGQTQLEQAMQATTLLGASSYKAGAASVTTSWGTNGQTTVSNWQYVIGALSINGGAGGSAPTVDTNPEGAAAPVGGTAVYAITATGATSYQWQVSSDGGETWANVTGGSGATTATYTTPTVVEADNGKQYRCRPTNANGTTDSLGAWFFVSGLASAGKARRATLSALWLRTVRRTGSIRGRGVNLLRGMPDNAPNRDSADLMAAWSTFFWEPSPPPPPAPASFPPINPSVRFAALLRF